MPRCRQMLDGEGMVHAHERGTGTETIRTTGGFDLTSRFVPPNVTRAKASSISNQVADGPKGTKVVLVLRHRSLRLDISDVFPGRWLPQLTAHAVSCRIIDSAHSMATISPPSTRSKLS